MMSFCMLKYISIRIKGETLNVLTCFLRTQRPMSSTTTYQNKSIYGNESVVNVAANKSSESSTHDDRAYEGLDSSTRKAVEEHYEALEV